MIKVYGIKNCDSVRKTLKFLGNNDIGFQFIDYRDTPISAEKLTDWIAKVGLEKLINTRSKTYKQLTDKTLNNQVILENITLIKRPVIETNNNIIIGFDEQTLQEL
jgi:arsenate reductase